MFCRAEFKQEGHLLHCLNMCLTGWNTMSSGSVFKQYGPRLHCLIITCICLAERNAVPSGNVYRLKGVDCIVLQLHVFVFGRAEYSTFWKCVQAVGPRLRCVIITCIVFGRAEYSAFRKCVQVGGHRLHCVIITYTCICVWQSGIQCVLEMWTGSRAWTALSYNYICVWQSGI